MGNIHNKKGKKVNSEAIDLINVDLSTKDYQTRNSKEHFGLLLPEAASMKLQMLGGTEDIFPLPAGWNPVACVKVYKTGSSITSFVAFY